MSNEGAKLGLKGWARNLDDGRVEAVIEGMENDVEKLIAWCHNGPPMARVDDIVVENEDVTGKESAFKTRY